MNTEILIMKKDFRSGKRFVNHVPGDVGFDLEVWNDKCDETVLLPNSFADLPTGIHVKVGDNSWGMIRPRSSTFYKRKLFVMEGTIDSGYTGALFIMVWNPNDYPVTVKNGDSLAQLIPVPKFSNVKITEVLTMPVTIRGEKGFGSTGGV